MGHKPYTQEIRTRCFTLIWCPKQGVENLRLGADRLENSGTSLRAYGTGVGVLLRVPAKERLLVRTTSTDSGARVQSKQPSVSGVT